MELKGKAILLKAYIGESDRVDGRLLYETIVEKCRKMGMAGATVYRGVMSFGASHSIHTLKIFALSGDLPIIIEIIDSSDHIKELLPVVDELLDKSKKGGLVTTEKIHIHRYRQGNKYKNIK